MKPSEVSQMMAIISEGTNKDIWGVASIPALEIHGPVTRPSFITTSFLTLQRSVELFFFTWPGLIVAMNLSSVSQFFSNPAFRVMQDKDIDLMDSEQGCTASEDGASDVEMDYGSAEDNVKVSRAQHCPLSDPTDITSHL